jgi:diguanylate cyclase (GGDEF)-like protein
MMDEASTLLFTRPSLAPQLADLCRCREVVRVADPYDALLEMNRRRWSTVVLADDAGELGPLSRASRQLQRGARLLAICMPGDEPGVAPLLDGVLDDYFIYPPTVGEIDSIRSQGLSFAPWRGNAAGVSPLTADEMAALVDAGRTVPMIESALAGLVGARLAARVAWHDMDKLPPGAQRLVLLANGEPRVLACDRAMSAAAIEACEPFLASLRRCVPALAGAAGRMQSLHRLAVTDHLTGAYNRRYFYHVTDRVLSRAGQTHGRVMLLLYDIDDFKHYNEAYGHAAGDDILRETAELMRQTTRSHDVVARIGGDEFAVLFWDQERPRVPNSRPIQAVYELTERFRRAVAQHQFGSLGPEARGALTISGGLASFPKDGATRVELMRSADRAMREAKRAGKNSIKLIG